MCPFGLIFTIFTCVCVCVCVSECTVSYKSSLHFVLMLSMSYFELTWMVSMFVYSLVHLESLFCTTDPYALFSIEIRDFYVCAEFHVCGGSILSHCSVCLILN